MWQVTEKKVTLFFAVSVKHRTAPASAVPLAKSVCEVKQLFCSRGCTGEMRGDTPVGQQLLLQHPVKTSRFLPLLSERKKKKINSDRHKTGAD